MRSSHLESGHYFYGPLFLKVNSSVLVLREECEQEDFLGDDFRIPFSRSAFCLVQQQIQFMRQRHHNAAVTFHRDSVGNVFTVGVNRSVVPTLFS